MIEMLPLLPLCLQDADEIMQSHSKHGEETSMQTLQSTEGPGTGDGSQAMVSLKA